MRLTPGSPRRLALNESGLLPALRKRAENEHWRIEFLDDDDPEFGDIYEHLDDGDILLNEEGEEVSKVELIKQGREDMAEILLNPVHLSHTSSDSWGVAVFVIVKDMGDIFDGRVKCARLLRSMIGVLCLAANFAFQICFLRWTFKYVSQPAVQTLQNSYAAYHHFCFHPNGTYSEDLCQELGSHERSVLCESVIRRPRFVLGVCALWTLAVLQEFRTLMRLYRQVHAIPELPYGIPTGDEVIEMRSPKPQIPSKYVVFALSAWCRCALYTCVVFPRGVNIMVLWYLGVRWLFATTGMCYLILNALVLLLIFQIPQILADGVLPVRLKDQISHFEFAIPASSDEEENSRVSLILWDSIRSFGYVGLSLSILFLYVACQANEIIPGYNQDLEILCRPNDMHLHLNLCKSIEDCFPYGHHI